MTKLIIRTLDNLNILVERVRHTQIARLHVSKLLRNMNPIEITLQYHCFRLITSYNRKLKIKTNNITTVQENIYCTFQIVNYYCIYTSH